jgi:phosphoglucosamine mutase
MNKKYFGTDGIRGIANKHPLTAEFATKLGAASGTIFRNGTHRHRVVIGKDTRLSGYLLEPALTSGFISVGMDVILVGPMPTPAIAFLTKALRADFGVMISASHNPYNYNGIKFFNKLGSKLSDEIENKIEALLEKSLDELYVEPDKLGKASRLEDAHGRYIEFVKNSFDKKFTLEGIKIVLDCANGSGYNIAPMILKELGANLIVIGNNPDGFNINKDCGSTEPELLQRTVLAEKADFGIAIDGDADRLLFVDEKGEILGGDNILAAIALRMKSKNLLANNIVVGTLMSNLGFERFLNDNGITLKRSQVGDRYVINLMQETGAVLGGEQSGHIICADHSYTADPMVAALQTLEFILEKQEPLSSLQNLFKAVPQIYENVKLKTTFNPLDNLELKDFINNAEKSMGISGRIMVRKSCTEPLIRIMGESDDVEKVKSLIAQIADEIAKVSS